MNYATLKLEFSPDPLSDTTPSWLDVSRYCRSASWQSGKAKDLDVPQAGGASFVLKNGDRRFEPQYAAGPYFPNIVPLRRFRLTITTSAGSFQQGIYYVVDWGVAYQAGTAYSEVTVTCVDGFGPLSLEQLPGLDPSNAATLADVQAFDQPFAQYTLSDVNSTKMVAATGTDGAYRSSPLRGLPALVPGDAGSSVMFGNGLPTGAGQCGRAPLQDVTQFSDGDAFTIEAVMQMKTVGLNRSYAIAGPWKASIGDHVFYLAPEEADVWVNNGGVLSNIFLNPGVADTAPHHIAATWDGNVFRVFRDGVEQQSTSPGGGLVQGDANEFLYVGGSSHVSAGDNEVVTVSHAAFYEQCLTPTRIAAHASAALNRGYVAQTAADRIASLAANPLWSTAGIVASPFTVEPRMQTGQATLDEISATVQAEMPQGLFYFDDNGNPVYQGWNQEPGAVQALFGDQAGEIPYTSIGLAYDDEIYNTVGVSRDLGAEQTASDATSVGSYATRALPVSGLILNDDADAATIAAELLARFKDPLFRVETLTLNGARPDALAQILTRDIGDLIRVRRRPSPGSTPIDVVTMILGKSKSFDVHGNLVCSWNLARGFDAADGFWHLGITGFSELGQTTVLA